jgi:WD40 repeat protein
MSRRCQMFLVLIFGICLAPTALLAATPFVPGHIYSTGLNAGYISELDANLQSVGRITLNGIRGESGATFNDSGNLVLICQDTNNHVLVREVDGAGQTLRQYDSGSGALYGGSYIDFDPSRRIYAFADRTHVTFLDANLSKIGATADVLGRASGVAFAQDGSLFATDQNDAHVRQFDSTTFAQQNILAFPNGWVATGLDVSQTGDLLLTSFGNGAVYRMKPATGDITQVVPNLGYGMMNSVMELPDSRLLTIGNYGGTARLFSATGEALASANSGSGIAECAVYYVPEPSTLALLATAASGLLGFALRRRWKTA